MGLQTLAGALVAALCLGATMTPAASTPVASAEPFPAAAIDFGGLPRTYVLHVPPGPINGLVINLHSAGNTGASHQALTHYDAIANAHGFVVAYPDGVDYSWADGRGASIPDRNRVDDVGFISTLVIKLVNDFGIDPNRVYATGLSAGAFMANRLACERADLFAAIAPVDGTLGTNMPCAPSEPVAVMATHGTADPIVPFNGGPMLGRGGGSTVVPAQGMADLWRSRNGCGAPSEVPLPDAGDGMRSVRYSSDDCADDADVVFTRVDGGGHTWPGAPTVLSVQQVGATTRAFDASVDSGNFFAQHVR